MDAFELLKSDHKRVSQLFEETESASSQGKRQVFTRLKADLDLHAHIEEKILYPALENTEEAREITLEAYEEHKVVKDLLAELAEGGEPDDEWDAKLTVLKENVEHHVEEEEGELFSKARKALSSEEIDRMGAEMEAEKARMQGGTAGKQDTSQARTRQSTKAAKTTGDQTRSATRRSSSESKQSESPGVLKRIASFIGLGDSSSGGTKRSKKSAKTSGAGKASPGKKAARGKPRKSAGKSAAKKSGGTKKTTAKSRTTAKTKSGGKTKSASKTTTSRANKRQASSATRGSAKAASRAAGSKKGKSRTSTKRSKTR